MQIKNGKVFLTIELEGRITSRGKYESKQKVDSTGKKVVSIEKDINGTIQRNDVFELRTLQLPSTSKAAFSVTLGSEFVNFAISEESRPKKISAPMWAKLPEKARLVFHVKKYAADLYPGHEFSFSIIEGEDETQD